VLRRLLPLLLDVGAVHVAASPSLMLDLAAMVVILRAGLGAYVGRLVSIGEFLWWLPTASSVLTPAAAPPLLWLCTTSFPCAAHQVARPQRGCRRPSSEPTADLEEVGTGPDHVSPKVQGSSL
jgi:hypothetical protein